MSDNDMTARKSAADKYDSEWPLRTTMGNLSREGFLAGWDAARASSSPSYTLAEWRSLALNYRDEWERETESSQTEFRLMLGLMFESLAKKEREGNERGT